MKVVSRKGFIKQLFKINNDNSITDNSVKYHRMGLECALTDYLNEHTTNYIQNKDNKPAFPDNGFVALNVEAVGVDGRNNPIIPFFSIAIQGERDTKELREQVLNISKEAKRKEFLTCPQFMNSEGLDKILFKVPIRNKRIVVEGISIVKFSTFDEKETPRMGSKEYSSMRESLLKHITNSRSTPRPITKTFIYSWCTPFLDTDQDLYCNVRAVDRDEQYCSHSIFLTILNSEDAVREWVNAYGEDVMNIITLVKSIFVNDFHQKQLAESIKSAISAIMSRNMSHNLGSHYLYYTKAHLEKLADRINEKMSPDIRGAAKVLGYTQARMDYLATLISNDKYPYGSVNFKSQLYDELTIDDFSKRHFEKGIDSKTKAPRQYNRVVNFLLSNLILSEDFTRPDIYDDKNTSGDFLKLYVQYSEDGNHYENFTGTNFMLEDDDDPDDFVGVATMHSEADIKNTLSSINLALPGGNMSCHAFFNVIENFIRNSAKYMRDDFERDADGHKIFLTNIALRYKDEDRRFIEIIIYDNKQNATRFKLLQKTKSLNEKLKQYFPESPLIDISSIECADNEVAATVKSIVDSFEDVLKYLSESEKRQEILSDVKSLYERWKQPCLYEQMCNRLKNTKIIGDNNVLDKENKGLKEMMFSSAWMRSYTFPDDKTFADIIFEIQQEENSAKKEELIHKHCFVPAVVVAGEKQKIVEKQELTIYKDTECLKKIQFEPACFAIILELPIFQKYADIEFSNSDDEKRMIQNCLNVYADIILADMNKDCPIDLSKTFTRTLDITHKGKSEIELMKCVLRQRFPDFDRYRLSFGAKQEKSEDKSPKYLIKFAHHLKDHENLEDNACYAYADSVSGGNFTKTMNELFDAAIDYEGNYKDDEGEYFSLKIKESALTRITLIDERLAKSMNNSGLELELQLKNIRILNYKDCDKINEFSDLFVGNHFSDKKSETHFLSIHLGLIEKIIKSEEFIEFVGDVPENLRAQEFMRLLRESFGGENVFVSVHSGRGNFSAELESQLAMYPFISLSSIEHTYNNSKYLLSQLFYNTVYIGKGRINQSQHYESSVNNY